MTNSPDSMTGTSVSTGVDHGLNARVFRTMVAATALAVSAAAFFASWRITAGLLIGGLLALFSHRWLKNSAAAAVSLSIGGAKPRIRLAQFLLRYIVIGAIILVVHQLELASLPAIFVGLCSFVVAMFVEAVRELYFAITQRGETC